MRVILFILGFYYIQETSDSSNNQQLLISNLISVIEPIYYFYRFHSRPVLSIDFQDIPIIGVILRALGGIFISDGELETKEFIKNAMITSDRPIVVFPEDMYSNGNFLIKFENYHVFELGLPITPILVKYPYRQFQIANIEDYSEIFSLFRGLCLQFVNYMKVVTLETYKPTHRERQEPFLYVEGIRKVMCSRIGFKLQETDHTAWDMHLYEQARLKLRLPSFLAGFYCEEVVDVFSLAWMGHDENERNDIFMFLSLYRRILPKLDLVSFEKYVVSRYAKELFTVLDHDNQGTLNFRKLVVGLFSIKVGLTLASKPVTAKAIHLIDKFCHSTSSTK